MTTKLLIKRYGDAPDAPPLEERVFDSDFTIGSDPAASVVLRGPQVAAEHVVVIREDGQMLLFNHGDGTLLNDSALIYKARAHLAHGDRLRIGEYLIVFDLQGGRAALPRTRETAPEETQRPAAQTSQTRDGGNGPRRNFAALLSPLRNAEDSYNFLIEGGSHDQQRVIIREARMVIGWDETGQHLAFDAALVAAPRATVRKERGGVFVEAQGIGMVSVNGESVVAARHLSDGDRVAFTPTGVTAAQSQALLVFHEPVSMTVLNELRLQTLPPPVPLQSPVEMAESLARAEQAEPHATVEAATPPRRAALTRLNPAAFLTRFYSTAELIFFAVCTLLLSLFFFLMFEFL